VKSIRKLPSVGRVFFVVGLGLAFFTGGCAVFDFGANFSTYKDVPFKSVSGENLVVDLYLPKTTSQSVPVVMVVHGGGWRSRSGDMGSLCQRLAKNGFAAVNVTYRLAPKHLYPAAVEDVQSAIQWIDDNAAKYNFDLTKKFTWGYSAGAHLALMVGLDPKYNFKAILAGGSPVRLEAWPKSPLVTNFIGKTMDEALPVWKDASPVYRVQTKSPPVFLYHGANDMLVEIDQMYFMENALKEKNIPVETYTIKMFGHVLSYLFSTEADRRGIEFIRAKI
jgi:acetyl esterase/lipase